MDQKTVESKVESYIFDTLDSSLYSVTYTESLGPDILAVTFHTGLEMELFVSSLGLDHLCDKSGYIEIPETYTVILYGMGLINLYTKL